MYHICYAENMQLDWIEDILAVIDTGSLARAAERRFLTQSAFTRRVRSIEERIGAPLFDRTRKPVTILPGVKALEPEMRDLSVRLHKLRRALKSSGDQAEKSMSFVCQHALTATVSPEVVSALTADGETSVRVQSGNRDECLMRLVSRDVDFAIMYAMPNSISPEIGSAFDAVTLGADLLVPVCTPGLKDKARSKFIPTIDYPPEVFFGQVVARTIIPSMSGRVSTQPVAETALTLAMLQLVLNDIGFAWLPRSLISGQLAQGLLNRVDDVLPAQPLTIRLIRLSELKTEQNELVWQNLGRQLKQFFRQTGDDTTFGGSSN